MSDMDITKLEQGKIYHSTHGLVRYNGLDNYMGQTTCHFTEITTGEHQWWLPETLSNHINCDNNGGRDE